MAQKKEMKMMNLTLVLSILSYKDIMKGCENLRHNFRTILKRERQTERERERDRERQTDRQTERERETYYYIKLFNRKCFSVFMTLLQDEVCFFPFYLT